jgi:hypothetical protein
MTDHFTLHREAVKAAREMRQGMRKTEAWDWEWLIDHLEMRAEVELPESMTSPEILSIKAFVQAAFKEEGMG